MVTRIWTDGRTEGGGLIIIIIIIIIIIMLNFNCFSNVSLHPPLKGNTDTSNAEATMCQGFSHFFFFCIIFGIDFLHYFVMARLATSRRRVKNLPFESPGKAPYTQSS